MNKNKDTIDKHSCFCVNGKVTNTLLDGGGNFYCVRCGKILLNTQVNDKILNGNKRNNYKSR